MGYIVRSKDNKAKIINIRIYMYLKMDGKLKFFFPRTYSHFILLKDQSLGFKF